MLIEPKIHAPPLAPRFDHIPLDRADRVSGQNEITLLVSLFGDMNIEKINVNYGLAGPYSTLAYSDKGPLIVIIPNNLELLICIFHTLFNTSKCLNDLVELFPEINLVFITPLVRLPIL